jgi:hypothetical protein|tara:strand:+ start:95 stop:604 length:510 start_codon:yes stop_codon:yes gene_type:complete
MGRVFFDTRKNVHNLSADYTALASDSGKVFVLNASSGAYTITLPTDYSASNTSGALTGWNCRFIVGTENDDAVTIFTGDGTDSGGDDFVGGLTLVAAQASDTSSGANGRHIVPAANDCEIVIDHNAANTGGGKGSYIDVIKLASDEWMVSGIIYTDDADSNGTALFTDN